MTKALKSVWSVAPQYVLSATIKGGEYRCDLCPFRTALVNIKLLDYHMEKHAQPGRWTGK